MKDIRVCKQAKKTGGQTVKMFEAEDSTSALNVYWAWVRENKNYLVTYEIYKNGRWTNKLMTRNDSL